MKKILLKHWKYLSVAILIIVLVFISLNYKEKEETFDIKETIITSDIVSDKVYVQISGEVNNPGVYEVNSNDRIIDVIELSNGLTNNADTSLLNLSKKVFDEMYIRIYSKKEVSNAKKNIENSEPKIIEVIKEIEKECICIDTNDACINEVINIDGNLININTASKEELKSLDGVGDSKAEKIVEYRTENKFKSIEDIMNVDGIGEAMFEKIKKYITI